MPATKKTTKSQSAANTAARAAGTAAKALSAAEAAERKAVRAEERIKRIAASAPGNGLIAGQVRGFVDFLREQSVVGLAIGLVLGTQAKVLVDQLVASFFNPLIGLLLPGEGSLSQKVFLLEIGGKTAKFGWGAFVVSLITFVIVAAVVYYVFKGLGLDKLDKKKE